MKEDDHRGDGSQKKKENHESSTRETEAAINDQEEDVRGTPEKAQNPEECRKKMENQRSVDETV